MAMRVRKDVMPFETSVDARHLYPASQLLTELITFGPQPNKAIVGENAFAHEAGIHQDGYLKERTTYEIMTPEEVGVPDSRLVLGKHSGRHALNERCEALGFKLSKEDLNQVYEKFIHIADGRKKGLNNDEILGIINEVAGKLSAAAS